MADFLPTHFAANIKRMQIHNKHYKFIIITAKSGRPCKCECFPNANEK